MTEAQAPVAETYPETTVLRNGQEWTLGAMLNNVQASYFTIAGKDQELQDDGWYLLDKRVLRLSRKKLEAFNSAQDTYDTLFQRSNKLISLWFPLLAFVSLVWGMVVPAYQMIYYPITSQDEIYLWSISIIPIAVTFILFFLTVLSNVKKMKREWPRVIGFRQEILDRYYPGIKIGDIDNYILLPHPEQSQGCSG